MSKPLKHSTAIGLLLLMTMAVTPAFARGPGHDVPDSRPATAALANTQGSFVPTYLLAGVCSMHGRHD
ncbi:MAG: hypothetical protein L0H73_13180, partial [Nitrococcus sp.]|nr:hypothetical protein [Nitrococcus sp.]